MATGMGIMVMAITPIHTRMGIPMEVTMAREGAAQAQEMALKARAALLVTLMAAVVTIRRQTVARPPAVKAQQDLLLSAEPAVQLPKPL